ncbi:MAG: hypothetical protein R3B82_29040 [Sandaracinaceae bacterium]
MTDYNKHNPYPHIATIRCPACGERAEFRKGLALVSKGEWGWWEPRLWPSARATNWEGTERWAPGDPKPAWRSWIIIEQDPALIRWTKPAAGYRGTDEGVVACARCVGRHTHVLAWPDDAFYRFELPRGVLWAWSREGADALIDFIESTQRDPKAHGPAYHLFLRHVPKHFLGAKDRRVIVKRLRRRLAELDG